MWIVELYVKKENYSFFPILVREFPKCKFSMVNGPYGIYWKGRVPDDNKKKIMHYTKVHHLGRQHWYRDQWDRSYDYREKFFEEYTGSMRCRYCNRPLGKKDVQVDHLIPVYQAKRGGIARQLLLLRKIENVNDVRNLVPSCKKCNKKKGTKMGIWYIRGVCGKYQLYWNIIYILKFFIFFILISFFLTYLLQNLLL